MGEINKIYTKEDLLSIIPDQLENIEKELNSHTWKHDEFEDKALNTIWRNIFYKNMVYHNYMATFIKLTQLISQQEVNNHLKNVTKMVELTKTLNSKFGEKISIPKDPTELINSPKILEKKIEEVLGEQMYTMFEIFTKFKKFQTESN